MHLHSVTHTHTNGHAHIHAHTHANGHAHTHIHSLSLTLTKTHTLSLIHTLTNKQTKKAPLGFFFLFKCCGIALINSFNYIKWKASE